MALVRLAALDRDQKEKGSVAERCSGERIANNTSTVASGTGTVACAVVPFMGCLPQSAARLGI